MLHVLRRTAVGAAFLFLPATAAAQAPSGPVTFGPAADAVTLCGFVGDTGPTAVLSTRTRVALQFPSTAQTIASGQEFRLGVTIQKGQSDCDDSEAVPFLRLPAGVQIANVTNPVTCRTFSSASPQDTVQALAGCPQQPTLVNGFLRLAPTSATWTLRNARDTVEVFVRVVASSNGQRTADARVCDLRSHDSFFQNGGACAGSPGANVTAGLGFTVGTTNGGPGTGTNPPPPQNGNVTWRNTATRKVRYYWGDVVEFKTTIDATGIPSGQDWQVVGGLRRQIQRRRNGSWNEVYDETVQANSTNASTRIVKKLTVSLIKDSRYRFRSCIAGTCSGWTEYRA